MVTAYNKPTMPYDVAFTEGMSRLDRAKSTAEGRPVDYARRGGAALIERGEMYPAMYSAAMRMAANRRSAEQDREIAWSRAAARKKALADKMNAQAVSSAVSGIGGLATDFARRGSKIGQREMTSEELGGRFAGLQEGGRIEETAPGSDLYSYTPRGTFEEMHRGPYWWETPGSTGGF